MISAGFGSKCKVWDSEKTWQISGLPKVLALGHHKDHNTILVYNMWGKEWPSAVQRSDSVSRNFKVCYGSIEDKGSTFNRVENTMLLVRVPSVASKEGLRTTMCFIPSRTRYDGRINDWWSKVWGAMVGTLKSRGFMRNPCINCVKFNEVVKIFVVL